MEPLCTLCEDTMFLDDRLNVLCPYCADTIGPNDPVWGMLWEVVEFKGDGGAPKLFPKKRRIQ